MIVFTTSAVIILWKINVIVRVSDKLFQCRMNLKGMIFNVLQKSGHSRFLSP